MSTKPIKLSARTRQVLSLLYAGDHAHLYHYIRQPSRWSMWGNKTGLGLRSVGREIETLEKAGFVEIKVIGDWQRDQNAYITPVGRIYHEANPIVDAAIQTWWFAQWSYNKSINPVQVISATSTRVTLASGETDQRLAHQYSGYYPTKEEAVKAYLAWFENAVKGAEIRIISAKDELAKARKLVEGLK